MPGVKTGESRWGRRCVGGGEKCGGSGGESVFRKEYGWSDVFPGGAQGGSLFTADGTGGGTVVDEWGEGGGEGFERVEREEESKGIMRRIRCDYF